VTLLDARTLLDAGLADLIRAGSSLPCHGRDEWLDKRRAVRERVLVECRTCPLLETCRRYAAVVAPTFGVYAGRDYTPTIGSSTPTRRTTTCPDPAD
jgi:hypothetical protein